MNCLLEETFKLEERFKLVFVENDTVIEPFTYALMLMNSDVIIYYRRHVITSIACGISAFFAM